MKFIATVPLCVFIACGIVSGHPSFSPNYGAPSSYWSTVLRVPHGCSPEEPVAQLPTFKVTVNVPSEITSLTRPQQLAGWSIDYTYRPMTPVTRSNGFIENQTVASISWTAEQNTTESLLSADQFQEFGLMLLLPNLPEGTKLYWPVIQHCVSEGGEEMSIEWTSTESGHGGHGGHGGAASPAPAMWLNATSDNDLAAIRDASKKSSGSAIYFSGLVLLIFAIGL
ncbi:MAG: hypothetical protein SGCHY_003395 [Lobulomycetales sp.]